MVERKDPDFGQQVKALFQAVVDLPTQEQAKHLAAAEVSPEILNKVKRLLKASEVAEEVGLTARLADETQVALGLDRLKAGMRVDQYELVEPVGRGGQGEVWLAQRADAEFEHRVAIKFLKPVFAEKEWQRFQIERNVLASLSHPNIAQLHGGGKQADGRLYMILEWVDGISITEYAQENRLNRGQILDCFQQVCAAVGFAHGRGIIHRDIKPSNILVTSDGVVKLLDFGIAKALDANVTQTQEAAMLTLAYSSPEALQGQPASTGTDVYGLGLVLYELLTGVHAFADVLDTPADLIQVITHQTPTRPSQLHPGEHMPKAMGLPAKDLDDLVLMALRKEPERRYLTVQGLSNDVGRYLRGEPLRASGDGWWYKTQKLIKRNKVASLLTGLLVAFLIALPITLYQKNRQIEAERDRAEQQATLAQANSDFLVTVLQAASPLGNGGQAVSLNDVLALGEQQLANNPELNPDLRSELFRTFAEIHHNLGDNQKAIKLYDQGAILSQENGDVPGQLEALGQQAIMAYWGNQADLAQEKMQAADSLSAQVDDPMALAWHKIRKATLMHSLGDYAGSAALSAQNLAEVEAAGLTDPDLWGRLYNELSVAIRPDDIEKCLEYNQLALNYAVESYGTMHPIYHTRLISRAINLIRAERYDDAHGVLREALDSAEKIYSKEHPIYAAVLAEQGVLWHDKGQLAQALNAYEQTAELEVKFSGKESIDYAVSINNIAYLYEDIFDLARAEPLYRESIRIRQLVQPDNKRRIASAQGNLARVLAKMGQFDEATRLLDQAMPVFTEVKRDNLYNELTQAAIAIDDAGNAKACENGLNAIRALLPRLEQESAGGWRRMRAELWIGELALLCDDANMAQSFFAQALNKARTIYDAGSDGLLMIEERIAAFQ